MSDTKKISLNKNIFAIFVFFVSLLYPSSSGILSGNAI